jgi:hypothetical protein
LLLTAPCAPPPPHPPRTRFSRRSPGSPLARAPDPLRTLTYENKYVAKCRRFKEKNLTGTAG